MLLSCLFVRTIATYKIKMAPKSKVPRTPKSQPLSERKLGSHSVDLMGGNFCFNYDTITGKHQTTVGGYVTILLTIVVLLSSLAIFSQYFNTEAPVVTSSTEFSSKLTEIDLYDQELSTPFLLQFGTNFVPANKALRYVTPKLVVLKTAFDNQTNTFESELVHTFDYAPCSELSDPQLNKIIAKMDASLSQIKSNVLCPDFKNASKVFKLYRDNVNSTFTITNLRLFPCSLPNPAQCASDAEMKSLRVQFFNLENMMVSSNFKKPVAHLAGHRVIKFDPFFTKEIEIDVVRNEIWDDAGVFRGPKLKEKYVTQHLVHVDNVIRPKRDGSCGSISGSGKGLEGCLEYISLNYKASGKVVKIRRNYRKLTTILGELGGFIKLVTIIIFFVYSYYNSWSVRNFLAEKVYKLGNFTIVNMNRKKAKKKINQIEDLEGNPEKRKREIKAVKNNLFDPKRYQGVIRECVRTRTSALDMINKLDFVEILQELLFDDHHQTLLPLLIIRLKEKKLAEKKSELKAKQKTKEVNFSEGGEKIKEKVGEIQQQNPFILNKKFKFLKKQKSISTHKTQPNYEEAYDSLKKSRPSSKLKKAINNLMLENLSEFFDDNKNEPKNQPGEEELHRKSPKRLKKKLNKTKTERKSVLLDHNNPDKNEPDGKTDQSRPPINLKFNSFMGPTTSLHPHRGLQKYCLKKKSQKKWLNSGLGWKIVQRKSQNEAQKITNVDTNIKNSLQQSPTLSSERNLRADRTDLKKSEFEV